MLPNKVKVFTIPLFPYLQHGRKKTPPTKRIRPADSLNLKKMVKEISKSTVITLDINEKPWSVTSVYSSYSPDLHVMLVETSSNRCLTGPERVPDSEGDCLIKALAAIMTFITDRKNNVSIHFGYNWSPRSWGKEEEKTGFQSIPTKWHPHVWCWPDFDNLSVQKGKYVKLINPDSLGQQEKRLLGNNNYAEPFGIFIRDRLKKTFCKSSLFYKLFPYSNWVIDGRGISVPFNLSIDTLLRTPNFFSRVLKPMAVQLDLAMKDLTETLTTMKCDDIDRILLETEKGYPKKLRMLRAIPTIRTEAYVRKIFKKKNYPESLVDAVFEPVSNRCNEYSNRINWWRKGFGYALVFSGSSNGNCGTMRIMPGVFVGPGGVVEAQGVILKRPRTDRCAAEKSGKKSALLWQLAENMKKLGFKEYRKKSGRLVC